MARTEDFRDRAVVASLLVFINDGSPLRPFPSLRTVGSSLCLPAPGDGRRLMRRTSRAFLATVAAPTVGMFAWLLGFALASSRLEKVAGAPTDWSERLALIGIVGFFAIAAGGVFLWTRGLRIWRPYLARSVEGRPGSPLGGRWDEPPSLALAIEDFQTFHKLKLLGDDFALVFFDVENRRIVAEGLTHRYVVRGEDVVALSLARGLSAAAVRVDARIGGVVLPLAFSEFDVWDRIPGCASRGRKLAEALYRRFAEALMVAAPGDRPAIP